MLRRESLPFPSLQGRHVFGALQGGARWDVVIPKVEHLYELTSPPCSNALTSCIIRSQETEKSFMSDTLLPCYEAPGPGSRKTAVIQHAGPNPYLTGGETYDAAHLGWGVFDVVIAGHSFNASGTGTYVARVIYPVAQASTSAAGSATVKIQWITSANSTEASNNTNLASEYVRLFVLGG